MADNIISIAKTFSTTEREFHVAKHTGLLIVKKLEEWFNKKQNRNYEEEDERPRVDSISYEEFQAKLNELKGKTEENFREIAKINNIKYPLTEFEILIQSQLYPSEWYIFHHKKLQKISKPSMQMPNGSDEIWKKFNMEIITDKVNEILSECNLSWAIRAFINNDDYLICSDF